MAMELGQTYCGWTHQDLIGQEDSQDVAIAQILDQGSISFGRYTVESLAWEKRSVFTHNRCQEELEKLKAPGLVAQKKAYFEAYYKKIRAMKALQANEQTELVVDYGGDDSSSCKNGELEDENVEHAVRNSATSVASACLEEHAAEDALEMESSSSFCCKYSDPKSVVLCPDFSTRTTEGDADSMDVHLNNDMISEPGGAFTDSSTATLKEIDMENHSIDSLECGCSDPEILISYDDSWREGMEDAALKNHSSSAQKMGHMSMESTLLDSPRRVEEIELLKSLCSDDDNDDDGWNVKEAGEAQHPIDDGTSTELSGLDSLMLKTVSDFPPVDNHINRKAKGPFNKQVNCSSTPRIKMEITECKTNSEVGKASRQPKQLLQRTLVVEQKNANANNAPSGRLQSKNKSSSNTPYRPDKVYSSLMVVKEENKIHLSSVRCQRLPRENKSASVSSSGVQKGLPSNAVGSCPISFATKRWPTNPGISRESGPQNSCSKSLNGSIHSSKQLTMQVSASSVKKMEITECKTNSEVVKASQQPKQLLQRTLVVEQKNANANNAPSGRLQSKNKSTSNTPYRPDKVPSSLMVVKEGNKIHLSSARCQRLPRENKSASVSSSGEHKPLPSNAIGSCPISSATKRWPTNPGIGRESGPQNSCSKSLNGSIHASKQLTMQLSTSVKGHAANGVKTAELGKKSYYGETPKAASVLNSRNAVTRTSNGLVQRTEARPINVPAVSEHSLFSRAGSGLEGERKEGKSDTRRRLFEGTSKTASAAPVRIDKSNLRKQVSSQTAGLVLDGKKSRQGAKPWR